MEANKILQADVLDILFEGRNKEYGAYELRKTYKKRLITALVSMMAIFLFVYGAATVASKLESSAGMQQFHVQDVQLEAIKPEEKKPDPIIEKLPPKQEPVKVEMQKLTPPKIVKDEEVKEPPPTQEKLEEVKIANITQAGVKDAGIVTPPPAATTTVAAAPAAKAEDYDGEFKTVQIQAKFPGGDADWIKFLKRNLNNSTPADNGASTGRYPVTVSFLVDKEGNVTEVRAENDPGYGCAEEAVRVIKRSGKWQPAEQNGRKVIYRQRQQIIFEVQEGQ